MHSRLSAKFANQTQKRICPTPLTLTPLQNYSSNRHFVKCQNNQIANLFIQLLCVNLSKLGILWELGIFVFTVQPTSKFHKVVLLAPCYGQ